MYFTQERDLARDAKKTELEFAKARELVSRIKAAFIGGKYPITRLVFMVLSVAALVVPYGGIGITLPYYTQKISLGAIGAYNLYSSGFYSKLLSLTSVGIAEKPAAIMLVWLGFFVLAVLAVLAQLVAYLLSFINVRRGHKALAVISGIGIVGNIAAAVMPFILRGAAEPYSFLTPKNGFGASVSLAVLVVFCALNIKMYKDNVQPAVKDVDRQRIEIAAKVKHKEIDLDDLPLPILETEEEREARLNALSGGAQKKKKEKKKKKGAKENG